MNDPVFYRICEKKGSGYYSLFHGTDGSRRLPLREWVNADIKRVRDGSGKKYYTSGFHVLPSYEEALAFFEAHFRIKENRVIVSCLARGIHRKEKSRELVLLADKIYLLGEVTPEEIEL